MDLGETRIPEKRAASMSPPDCRTVRSFGVSGEVENIGISPRCEHNHVGRVAIDLAGDQIPRHNAARDAIDKDDIEQLIPDVHRYSSGCDLLFEGLIGAEQELLSRLASSVKGSFDLHAAKRAIVEKSAILPCKRHALRDALINDVDADFRQAMHVGFTGAKIAAFDSVLEEAENTVAVIAKVLCGINPSLRCDRVCAPWGVMVGKAMHVIALLAESGGRGRTCQTPPPQHYPGCWAVCGVLPV